MKKLSIVAAFALATGAAFHFNAFSSASLKELVLLNKAEANCNSTSINNGRCSFGGNCFAYPFGDKEKNCDTTKG